MSAQICLLIIVIAVSMAILFRKIVRTDARDDFKIKNILKYSDMEEQETTDSYDSLKENVQESMSFSQNNEFRTEIHQEDKLTNNKKTESYREKEPENIPPQKEIWDEPKLQNTKNIKVKRDILQMIKSFYRGITFTVGLLVCLYALFGVIRYAQTTDDAIIYSIWLLIGVILIK